MSRATNISAQTAAKAAGNLFQGTGNIEDAMSAMTRFYNGIMTLGGEEEPPVNPPPLAAVVPVNPPLVPVVAPTQLAQAETALAQGGVVATVSRDLSTPEARWQDALNPATANDWYNNIGDTKASSGGGKGPDFRFKNESAGIKGLWLNGQYGPAPAWVFERLGLQFPGAPAPVAPIPGPAPVPVAPVAAPGTVQSYGPDEAPF